MSALPRPDASAAEADTEQVTTPASPAPGEPRRPGLAAEVAAAVLGLASALCGLAAVALFVLPAVRGDFTSQPQLLTLAPSFDSPAPAQPKATPVPSGAPEAPDRSKDLVREERADFSGAILLVESTPSGATVLVEGKEQGETPLSMGLECRPGEPLQVELTLRGHQPVTHRTSCPRDAMLKLTARLRRAARP